MTYTFNVYDTIMIIRDFVSLSTAKTILIFVMISVVTDRANVTFFTNNPQIPY